jgi:hypothetical protein
MSGFGVAAAAAALAGILATSSQATASVACGAATTSTVSTADVQAMYDIYKGENVGPEVHADSARITSSQDLLTALASNDQAATLAAVTRIVYTPHWHIVRLRVLSSSGRLLADVGGPYIIAPVTGSLTYHGAVVGTYEMSVQDDVGYTKLVTRFSGLPIALYLKGKQILARDFPASEVPAHVPPNGTRITVNHHLSTTVTYTTNAFPSGLLHVLLAVPRPRPSLAAQTCEVVTDNTLGHVDEHIARLYDLPADYNEFVMTAGGFGAKFIFVRNGATQIAGTFLNGPSNLPNSGPYVFNDETFQVFSFSIDPPTRIYLMFAPLAATGTTGASGTTGTSGTTGASGSTAATGPTS